MGIACLLLSGDFFNGRKNGPHEKNVYGKNRNRILKGANYRSFVNYWVPVYGGIGLHDATWREEFGGEIYKKSGSHGCVNTPLEKMAELYDLLEVGMPVVIHY